MRVRMPHAELVLAYDHEQGQDINYLLLDGEEFPFALAEEGPKVSGLARGNVPMLTLTILCDSLTVKDTRFAESISPSQGS